MMINSLRSGADTTNATKTASPAAPTPAAPTATKPPVDEAQLKAAVQAANSAMWGNVFRVPSSILGGWAASPAGGAALTGAMAMI